MWGGQSERERPQSRIDFTWMQCGLNAEGIVQNANPHNSESLPKTFACHTPGSGGEAKCLLRVLPLSFSRDAHIHRRSEIHLRKFNRSLWERNAFAIFLTKPESKWFLYLYMHVYMGELHKGRFYGKSVARCHKYGEWGEWEMMVRRKWYKMILQKSLPTSLLFSVRDEYMYIPTEAKSCVMKIFPFLQLLVAWFFYLYEYCCCSQIVKKLFRVI